MLKAYLMDYAGYAFYSEIVLTEIL